MRNPKVSTSRSINWNYQKARSLEGLGRYDDAALIYRQVTAQYAGADPEFLLVSILDEADRFVGYGGLTHIDWEHRRGEVSFLMETERARNAELYARDLGAFLAFLKSWAFDELGLERIFTETYAFRDAHIALLENAGFVLEGRMSGHVRHEGRAVDCLIHAVMRNP